MTLEYLQTLCEGPLGTGTDGRPLLVLDLSDEDTVLPVVQLYLPGNALRISNPGPLETINSTTARLSGIGVDAPYNGMSIEVNFVFQGQYNNQMYFSIIGTTENVNNEAWSLDYGFDAFTETIFSDVPFVSGVKCYLYTQETELNGELLPAGMYIDGYVDLARMSGGFSSLLGVGTQYVEGYVDMSSNGEIINDLFLNGTSTIDIDIVVATLQTVEVTLTYDVVQDPTLLVATALPFFQVTGQFSFNSEGVEYRIPVYMRAWNSVSMLFESDITELIQAGVTALMNLTKGVDIRSYLPTDANLDTLVQLTDIYANFDTTSKTITNIGIEIQHRTPLLLADIGFSHKELFIDNIVLTFEISQVFSDNPQGFAFLQGNITLADIGSLDVSATFPDLIFTVSISEGTEIYVSEFINLILGSECGLPDLIINDFSFNVVKQPQVNVFDYDLSLTVFGGWWIGTSALLVESIALVLTSNPRYFSLVGNMYVANILLDLEAEYTGQDGEWIFTGGTADGAQGIKVGYLVEQLAAYFTTDDAVPAFISEMTITNIGTTFNTLTHDFTFHLEIHDVLVEGGPTVDLKVDIDIHKQNDGTYRKTFTGQLFLNTGFSQNGQDVRLAFDLVFSVDVQEYVLLATYTNLNGSSIYVKSLVGSLLGPHNSLTTAIPDSLTFTLKDALFAWYAPDKTVANSKVLFVLDMEDGINLSSLPLVGGQFPTNQTAKLAYKVMAASGNFLVSDINYFNSLLPDASAKFPPPGTNADGSIPQSTSVQVTRGMSLCTTFQLGPVHQTLNLPVALNEDPTNTALLINTTPSSTTPLPVQPLWFNVQKTFGPVYFGRIGILYDNSDITFYLDASMNVGSLSLAVDGLSVRTPLNELSPSFDIKGIAVDFSEGGLEINGALLHQVVNGDDVYNGTATIKLESFGLAVLGSYSYSGDYPSMFIYGVLSAPLGGIPAFFVTGLSAGFGYNRDLRLPLLTELDQFPLVSEAMGTTHSAATLDAEMTQLSQYIPPMYDNYWGAAGVKFTTYKVVDSFALITIGFGNHLSLNLMGMATAVVPPMATGNAVLAEIQMALLASIDLASGFVGFSADLTGNSFVLSRDARLTGGFAFYAWYSGDHAMDFALTVGGYNPKFIRPGHYPIVPRVGLNWQIDSKLSVKGQLYFALTPGMMMAGGGLEMTWVDDNIRVWFSAGIDLIMGWKPFTYSASANIQVGASYKGHFGHVYSLSASASLDVWGPDFSGKAKIDLVMITVTVQFGKSKKQSAKAIDWTEFKDSFIPENALTFSVSKGLVAKNPDGVLSVSQHEFEVVLDSLVPFNSLNNHFLGSLTQVFGIAPMGITGTEITINLNWTGIDQNLFDVVMVKKNVPAALWGSSVHLTPQLTDNPFVSGALCGYVIKPKPLTTLGNTVSIPVSVISYSTETAIGTFRSEDVLSMNLAQSEREILNEQIVSESAADSRQRLMAALGVSADINLTNNWADMFIELPATIL